MPKFNVLSWIVPAWIILAVIGYSSCASLPPEGFELCREDQFTCKNEKCIPISYLCDKDFDCADGSDEEICAVGCQLPLGIENGKVNYENPEDPKILNTAPDNYVLQFQCSRGYDLSGPKTLFCIRGEWSDKFPMCLNLHCRSPPVIGNGTYQVIKGVSRSPIIGSKTTYSCKKGFELENQDVNELTCKLNGTSAVWTGELPVCREKEVCPDPGVSPDGKREGNCCYKGDVLKFSCKKDYKRVGRREIECLAGGSWSGRRARCKPPGITCPDPPKISNGFIQSYSASDFVQPEEDIVIKCNDGYSFRGGQDNLYCDDDGLWDDEFGRCEVVPCKFPEIPLNGTIVQLKDMNATEFPDGFYLSYACDSGFRLKGFSWNTCHKSRWRFELPKCEVIKCSDPGTPENAVREGSNFDVGSKVTYTCFSGYAILGSVERYCLSNGQWSGEITRCNSENNYCPDPGIPVNGMKTGNVYDEGSIVEYRCNPGFSLLGNDTRICQSNHVWTGEAPKCLGAYDFDNNADVSIALQAIVETQVETQEEELIKYEETLKALLKNRGLNFSSIGEMELAIMRSRTLDLNYPGRIVLYFIFDASGSVGSDHFKTSVEFAKALVKKVGISDAGARAGALSFSSTASVHFMPFELSTTEAVLTALDEIEYTSGGTAISVAFEKVQTDMIPTSKAILGPNQKSVIFILTDGKSNMGGDPEILADALKTEAGVEIYCIGITGSTAVQSLYRIASKPKTPDDEHVFILDNYGTLSWLIQKITNGSIDYSECGVGLEQVAKRHVRAKRADRGRIIGGLKAVEPWPWMAALYFTSKDRPNQPLLQCGGSIIAKQWILTAAHCLVDKSNNNQVRERNHVIIRLGLTSLKNETNLVEFEPMEMIIHEKYEPITLDYDMALIKLDRIIEFNAYVRPICLPPKELPPDTTLYKPNEKAFVAGWGHDKKRGEKEKAIFKTVDHLKELVLPIKSDETCKNSLNGRPDIYVFTERMFCAGSGIGEVDTCQGDSGGPMMQSQASVEKNVYWVQMGVVSWGIGCGQINTFGYYTQVQRLRDWIDEKINPG